MNFLRKYLNNVKPNFESEGKLHAFRSLFDGFETFLFVPNQTSKTGVNIHDAIDSKRIMSFVVIALLPALLFGMYNVGFQNYKAAGALADASFFSMFLYGALQVLPKIIVSYVVGLASSSHGHSGKARRFRRASLCRVSSFRSSSPLAVRSGRSPSQWLSPL